MLSLKKSLNRCCIHVYTVKYVILITLFDKNKIGKKENLRNDKINEKLKQNETNSN